MGSLMRDLFGVDDGSERDDLAPGQVLAEVDPETAETWQADRAEQLPIPVKVVREAKESSPATWATLQLQIQPGDQGVMVVPRNLQRRNLQIRVGAAAANSGVYIGPTPDQAGTTTGYFLGQGTVGPAIDVTAPVYATANSNVPAGGVTLFVIQTFASPDNAEN